MRCGLATWMVLYICMMVCQCLLAAPASVSGRGNWRRACIICCSQGCDCHLRQSQVCVALVSKHGVTGNRVCACMLQSADKDAKVHELRREADQLELEHARKIEDIKNSHAQELREAQREHEDEVAQLESHVTLLESKLEGLQTQQTSTQTLQAAHVSLHALLMTGDAARDA